MSAHVSLTAKDFLITSDDPHWLHKIKEQLVIRCGEHSVFSTRGFIRVNREFGPEVFAVLRVIGLWDKDALELAEEQAQFENLQSRARAEVDEALASPEEALYGFDLISRLDQCQRESVAALTVPSLQGMAIFDEQGVGKTAMGVAAFHRLRTKGAIDRLLVVAPKSTLASWQAEFVRLTGDRYVVKVCPSQREQRRKDLLSPYDVLIITYESLTTDAGLVRMLINASSLAYMMVVDESYLVKNPDAKRSKAVQEVRQVCKRAVILCGTPAPNAPIDIVAQIDLMDNGATFRGVKVPKEREEARATVRERLTSAIYLRRVKADVLPFVPAKTLNIVELSLEPVQSHLYLTARDSLVNDLLDVDEESFNRMRSSFLARRSALLQICSHPGAISPNYTEIPSKFIELDNLLAGLIDQGEKVVLWSFFRFTLASLEARYSHLGLVRVDGSVESAIERGNRIERFQNDPKTKIFLGNAAAAGAGITLTAARHAIYESLSNQGAHYMQSLDRIHRRGQNHDVTFHLLRCRDTIEESHLNTLMDKERMSRELLPTTRENLLSRQALLEEVGGWKDAAQRA